MKKFFIASAVFCLIFCTSLINEGFAQGFNSIVTPDGTYLVAVGNSGKLYRSASAGTTWTSYINGALNMNSVTSFGNDVWIAANNGTVYKTLKTNSPITTYTIGASDNLNSIAFINANTGYVCGDAGAIYKTVNGGINWTSMSSGIGSTKLNSIAFKDASNGITVGNNGEINITNNGGASWSTQSSGTTRNLLKVKYFNDSAVITGEYGTLLKNSGAAWTSIITRTNTDIRGIDGTSMSDVHVCGGGGFIRNNKNGNSAFLNFEVNPMMANLTDITYFDNNNGWAVSSLNSVVIYTTNAGTNWIMPAGSTVSYSWVAKLSGGSFLGNNFAMHPVNRNTMFVVFGTQVYRSLNRGENWSSVGVAMPGSGTPHSFFVSPLDTNIWLCAQESATDIVVRSTNYGASWSTILTDNFSNYGQPLEIDQNNPSTYYFAPDGGGFWKSTNNGASFSEISTQFFRSPCEILVTWDSSEVILLGDGVTSSSERAKMFKSTNGGFNWAAMDSVTSSETPSMCNTVFEKNLIWCTEWGGSNVYKSTDYGSDFSVHYNTGFSGWGSDVSREDPTLVIIGSWGNAATLSTNGGSNWVGLSSGLSGHGGGIIIPDRGYALSQQGTNVYKLNIVYTDNPVVANIDVQVTSLGGTGSQIYSSPTINPSGVVKNNNGADPASFTVIRTITPGNYVSTKTISNLGPSASTSVTFDPWTFNSGSFYTIKDSAFITGDVNNSNNVLSAGITPFVGQSVYKMNEGYSGTFPPAGWTFEYTGTNYWIYNAASAYGLGVGSAEYNFWNAPSGTIQSLLTPVFSSTVTGDSLEFDRAYASYNSGTARDSLFIETSTNSGSTYTTLLKMFGSRTATIGGNTVLNTTTSIGGEYFPSTNHWVKKKLGLPSGTNKIRFRARSGFGNNLFLDSMRIRSSVIYTQVNLKLAPEGLYNGSTLNLRDTVYAFLRSTTSPFAKIDSSVTLIDSLTLTASCVFQNAASGTYYVQIIHRNAIESWSKIGGENIVNGVTYSYDFTSAQGQTYGNNSKLTSGLWTFFSGDVNHDGSIDGSDLSSIDNDAANFQSGYFDTDLNGDGIVDGSDLLIADNNASNFVTKVTPEVSPVDKSKNRELNRNRNDEYHKFIDTKK
ncbi:MAG: YCF48-related protein [Ignavibacteria bacterium]